MKRIAMVCAVLLSLCATVVSAADPPKKALCTVCAVQGESKAEKVRAQSIYDGAVYYFCSSDCKEAFEEDPVAYVPPTLPRTAPDAVVETLDGADVALSDFEGKVVLLDFWATWCKPCVKIMPQVQSLYDRHKENGFAVMGVSIDEGDNRGEKIRKFIDKYDITYPIYSDTGESPAWHTYRVKAVPAMFLIDRSGNVVAQWLGTVDHDEVEREVARLMDGSTPVAE